MMHYYTVLRYLILIAGSYVSMLFTAEAQTTTCPNYFFLNSTQVTATSASIAFTYYGSNINLTYAPLGASSSSSITITAGTTSPIALTGLLPATTYEVSLQGTCPANNLPTQIGTLRFKTDCTTATVYPYLENFDGLSSYAMPCGYTILDVNNDMTAWNNSSAYPSSASNSMRYGYSTRNAADDWFFTRGLQMQAGTTYQLQFKYAGGTNFYTEALEVKIGSANTAAGQTITLFANNNIQGSIYATTGAGQVASFTPTTSGIYYIGFHAISQADMLQLFVDDIQVTASVATATKSSMAPSFRAEASPVPFGEQLVLSLNTLQAGPLQLTLHDALGRVMRQHSTTVLAGPSSLAVPEVGTLPAGMYLLTVRQGGNTQVIRVAHE
jgi:hypothetical protein